VGGGVDGWSDDLKRRDRERERYSSCEQSHWNGRQ